MGISMTENFSRSFKHGICMQQHASMGEQMNQPINGTDSIPSYILFSKMFGGMLQFFNRFDL
jgi:hypothetical protein